MSRKPLKSKSKSKNSNRPNKKPYLTAKQLGILPEERTALIAFTKADHIGNAMRLNGHAHYYDQTNSNNGAQNGCGTSGCVAGYVFAYARHVGKKKTLRGATGPNGYISVAWGSTSGEYSEEGSYMDDKPISPFLYSLYSEGEEKDVAHAQKVVDKALRTNKVKW